MAYAADKLKISKAKTLTLLTHLSDYSVENSVFPLQTTIKRTTYWNRCFVED